MGQPRTGGDLTTPPGGRRASWTWPAQRESAPNHAISLDSSGPIKGSRQWPAQLDPKLADLAGQLGQIACPSWEEEGQQRRDLHFKRAEEFPLSDGSVVPLPLEDARKETVTFQVKVPARRTGTKLTSSKGQRIIHQVTDEENGEVYVASIRPWP